MAAICIGVFVGYASYPDNKALADIFELIKIGALPLITLIVSFYFPNSAKWLDESRGNPVYPGFFQFIAALRKTLLRRAAD
ncbi:hypothetical protein ACQE3D_00355 [Methylomonas sp. MS20]|uniref:hypothetical protein n=1 Tax=unclassified Methylomonas TaxID=2608980 RepID=UPI0028A52138|nr:hypothetical protein [Methylomonas sp. MV1]MDT4330676.1 hypothetical protein [Methylomonas sp. MV1]